MAGLLSGLGALGLKNLESMDLYEEEKKEAVLAKDSGKTPVIQEADYLFDKTYECPVCYGQIKARTMKVGKAKLSHTDLDLRPVYENIEPLKYDVISCPHCGYSTLTRYFGGLTSSQSKAIKENISRAFKPANEKKDTYTYEEAVGRYKLCLANAIVKHAKASEKAYICLKAGWLIRSMRENCEKAGETSAKEIEEIKAQENEFLQNALEGFVAARQAEGYPMCGMDETTVDYLISALSMEFEQYDVASKMISSILTSPAATNRMKDKARDLKEVLLERIKEKKTN